jgi:soluble lytic murein transglycosylase-like protein
MILDFARADARAIVAAAANAAGLEPSLVAAIVLQESGGNPLAIRHESEYRWLWPSSAKVVPPPGVSLATEIAQQRTSWGLLQVMGATAREHGCREPFLTALIADPALGLRFGCLYLASLFARFPGAGREGAISAYNAGHPTPDNEDTYVRRVIARLAELQTLDWTFC